MRKRLPLLCLFLPNNMLLTNMGYQGHGSLNGNKKALMEPLSHTQGRIARDTTGLGFGAEDDMLLPTQNVPTSSDSEDDESPTMAITSHGLYFVPTTSLLWGDDAPNITNDAEASTSQ